MTDTVLRIAPAAEPSAPAAKKPFKLPVSPKAAMAVGGALLAALVGAWFISLPKATVTTDAAYIEADSSTVAPKVRGLVSEVLVQHNQVVRRGQPLVRIDAEEFASREAAAAANLANAQAAVLAARAAFVGLDAEEQLAASNIVAARSVIGAATAENERAQADRVRFENLVASGTVARRDADQVRATAIAASSDVQRRRAEFEVSRNQAAVTHAKRATLAAGLAQAEAAVASAQAALDLARQDQGHALVRAPIDGVVGDRQVEPGDYVQPGTRLLTVVPLNALYVTANFKETQVARMVVGQTATLKVDALPGVTLTGKVESFAPGSGSQFSLLPFEPGTGNFTKIVQRVPVRIRLDPGQQGLDHLRPGLSTTVKVRLKGA